MFQTMSTFDGYIGVKIGFDPKKRITLSSDPEQFYLSVAVRWAPVSLRYAGQMAARFAESKAVPGFEDYKVFFRYEDSFNDDLICEQLWDDLGSLLSAVEDHFCKIGQCKVNPKSCPESKKVSA